jgi:carbon monoxide dehydrogenase subunit G
MATFENTVMIGRPIEEVFGFLADFENIPRWNYAIVETRKVSKGPVGVGTIYRQVRSVPSRSEERFEVTVYDPPRQLEIQGQLGPFPSRLSYALDAVPEGTRVTNSVELQLRGPGRLLGRVAVPRVRDAVAANLRKLKELLEQ